MARAESELYSQNIPLRRFFYNKHSEASFYRVRRRVLAASLDGLLIAPAASRKIPIIGYDLIDENVRYLREGVIDFLISQQPERQGYKGISTLYRHVILKEPVPKKVMMQIDIVTSENVDFYRS